MLIKGIFSVQLWVSLDRNMLKSSPSVFFFFFALSINFTRMEKAHLGCLPTSAFISFYCWVSLMLFSPLLFAMFRQPSFISLSLIKYTPRLPCLFMPHLEIPVCNCSCGVSPNSSATTWFALDSTSQNCFLALCLV